MSITIGDLSGAADGDDEYGRRLEDLLVEVEDEATLERFAEAESERVSALADLDPSAALARLSHVTAAIAQAAQNQQGSTKQPRLIRLLTNWVSRLKAAIHKLKASLGFQNFSISVTLGPVSVGLTW